MTRVRRSVLLLGFLGCLASDSASALTKAERKEAKAMLSGTLYLRVDAPWTSTGSAVPLPFAPMIKEPLIDITPQGAKPERQMQQQAFALWELGVNDAVQLEDFEVEKDGAVHIDLQPASGEEKHGVLHFVGINTLADFRAAVGQAFSRVPLQDEHADWPAEVRRAIAERRLIDGMTKRQAYCVAGLPASFEQREEGGKHVEVWRLKLHRMPRYSFLTGAANGAMLRFEDGKLVGVGSRTAGEGVRLDQ